MQPREQKSTRMKSSHTMRTDARFCVFGYPLPLHSLPTRRSSDLRERILALVVAQPGLHLRELPRRLGLSLRSVRYHLETLVDQRIPDGSEGEAQSPREFPQVQP